MLDVFLPLPSYLERHLRWTLSGPVFFEQTPYAFDGVRFCRAVADSRFVCCILMPCSTPSSSRPSRVGLGRNVGNKELSVFVLCVLCVGQSVNPFAAY